jgi:hypothetical protein
MRDLELTARDSHVTVPVPMREPMTNLLRVLTVVLPSSLLIACNAGEANNSVASSPVSNAVSNATPDPSRPAVVAAAAPTPLRADGPIRVRRGVMVSILSNVDEGIAQRLAILPNANFGDLAITPIARRREPADVRAFIIVTRPVANDGANVIMTLTLAPNSDGEAYRLTLSAIQGRNVWARTIERGRGRERPGFERLSAGEEGPMMTLIQRLGASLPADVQDLSKAFVEHATWEIGR